MEAAHLVEHAARELLRLAGQPHSWGFTEATSTPHVARVVFAHDEEDAGELAAHLAFELCEGCLADATPDVASLVRLLHARRHANLPGPSTASLLAEAKRRGIPTLRVEDGSHFQLGYGARHERIQATLTGRTSALGVEIVDDKARTKRLLVRAGVPVAPGEVVRTVEGALAVADEIGYPVVVKPLIGNHGRGITTNVRAPAQLAQAFALAAAVHPKVLVERHLVGRDFRLLVIGHKLVAAARRDPAQVVGEGASSVAQLVDRANADPRRGEGHENVLTRITLDEASRALLADQGLAPESVPEAGRVVVLKTTANLSTGGTATDVTDELHPDVRVMAERISRVVRLDVCGIDVVAPHLQAPLAETGGGVCEVNAAPGFRMHVAPSHGKPRDVAGPVLNLLFPEGNGRIPIAAITGTNGKTTSARLLAHVLRSEGAIVGLATTSGVEVHEHAVLEGDYAGPSGAHAVLADPTVTHAVLEVARGGILRKGLGFDACDVAVMLNVAADHLGQQGVETLEDLVRVKATVVRALRPGGTAILNADDPLCLDARKLAPNVILFSTHADQDAVLEHLAAGGTALMSDAGQLWVCRGKGRAPLAAWSEVPLTDGGRARFNVQNVLAATAAALALGVPEARLAHALATFHPTPVQNAGRLNAFARGGVKVFVDYGHNAAAVRALAEYLSHLPATRRITSANGSGNRRDEDLRDFGAALADAYGLVFLSDTDPRGRAPGETPRLIREGALAAGAKPDHVRILEDEESTLRAALSMAQPGDVVVLQADDSDLATRLASAWAGPEGALTPEAPPEPRALVLPIVG